MSTDDLAGASGCPATARPTRDLTQRWPGARAAGASPSGSGPGDRHPDEDGAVTGVRTATATSRPRPSSTAPDSGPRPSARGRGDGTAALGRALLRRHRAVDGVHPDFPVARPGRLHLLQGGGRRPGGRRLRAGRQAVGRTRRAPVPVRVPAAGRGLGPLRDPDGQRDRPVPVLADTGIKMFYNGPESFTPDNQFILGRGAGAAELLRRRRLQLGGHRLGRRRRRRSPSGSPRASRAWTCRRSTSAASPPSTATTSGCRTGSARRSGCTTRSVAQPRADRRPAVQPVPGVSPAQAGHAGFGTKMGWERANLFGPAGPRPTSNIAGAGRTGARVLAPSSAPPAPRSPCSTRPAFPSTW